MPSQTFLIVGARFRPPAEDVLNNLPVGQPLILRRQPDNPYDENAIAVLVTVRETPDAVRGIINEHFDEESSIPEDLHLGFIPREYAKLLAPKIDALAGDDMIAPDVPGVLKFGASGGPLVKVGED